ncbi:MAG: hypothetical protein K1X53_01600 [Candidatus Sumerlaeaceae bacterium]|nr:hypothetical protein [Candidatus Sumerlaeaceae bacterium]
MSDLVARIERELNRRDESPVKTWARRGLIALIAIALPFIIAECALRIAGFYRPQISMGVQLKTNKACAESLNDRFHTDAFEPDRYMLWRLKAGSNVAGMPVNKNGLLYTDSPQRNEKSPVTVLCLGDSVTGSAYRSFPQIAQRLVSGGRTNRVIEFINAAVAGYSTEQGLRWYRELAPMKPQIVLACFGWNDRFPALNLPDRELGARTSLASLMHRLFYHWRVYQYLAAPEGDRWARVDLTTTTLRVGPEEYEQNLRKLVSMVRANDALPVLATQPENLTASNLSHFEKENFVAGEISQLTLHREYNVIVRRVAQETRVPLLDLEEEFDRRTKSQLFEPDGMHLSGPGQNLVARLLIGVLRNQDIISQAEFEAIVRLARYDTTAPDKPHAAWIVNPQQIVTSTTGTASVSVIAKNTGNTKWLKSHVVKDYGTESDVKLGTVSIVGRWRTVGSPTTAPLAMSPLAHDLLSGETTSQSLTFRAPPTPGEYMMEISLQADRVGDLKNFGAETTTLTVISRQP